MEGRFHEPADKIILIFSNEHYERLRMIPEFAKRHNVHTGSLSNELEYADMPLAREWADELELGI